MKNYKGKRSLAGSFSGKRVAGNITRKCDLREFDLTAHANRDELLEFVGRVSPKVVVLTHGDAESRGWFAQQIAQRYPGMRVLQPGPGETVEC